MENVELATHIRSQAALRMLIRAAAVLQTIASHTRCLIEMEAAGNVTNIKSSEVRLAWMLTVPGLGRSF